MFLEQHTWRVCSQKPISPFLSIFRYGHHTSLITYQELFLKLWSKVSEIFLLFSLYFSSFQSQISQFHKTWLIGFCKQTLHMYNVHAEMPTSTFLPYFVRFLKENTAVRFFFFFFFFFNTGEWKFYITHIIYVMKTWSEFLNDNVKRRLRLHQRAPKTRVFPGRKDFVLRARDARSARKNTFFHLKYAFLSSIILFFLWQVGSYAVRSLAFVIFYKILFFG